jgi:hypothetical protein
MTPRHNVLLYLEEYGDVLNKRDAQILFERINTSVRVFKMILHDLNSLELVKCNRYTEIPSDFGKYYFDRSLEHLKVELTERGQHYINFNIKGESRRIEIEQNKLNFMKINNIDFSIPHYSSLSFNELKYKWRLTNCDMNLVYFLLTGKKPSQTKPKLFISYSWGEDAHQKWVKALADKLSSEYEMIFDQYGAFKLGSDMFVEMKNAIIQSDIVLVILNPTYKIKAETNNGGVGYEASVITSELKKYLTNDKYVPVLREGERFESVPSFFENNFYFDARKGRYKLNKLRESLKSIQ